MRDAMRGDGEGGVCDAAAGVAADTADREGGASGPCVPVRGVRVVAHDVDGGPVAAEGSEG